MLYLIQSSSGSSCSATHAMMASCKLADVQRLPLAWRSVRYLFYFLEDADLYLEKDLHNHARDNACAISFRKWKNGLYPGLNNRESFSRTVRKYCRICFSSYARLGHLLHVPCALREPINLDTTHLDADVESGFELLEWLEGMVGGRLPFRRSAGMNCCAVSRSTPMSGATSNIRVLALDVYNPGQPRYEITTSKSKVRSRRQCQLQLGVCAVTRPQSYIRDRQYVGRTRPGGSSRFFFRNH